MLFVLTGNAKGKTTCAIGMGLRAAGAGRSVLMVQFLKSGRSSENKVLERIDGFDVKSFGRDVCISKENVSERDVKLAQAGFEFAKRAFADGRCDFLILDEICVAMHFGLLDKKEVLNFLARLGSDPMQGSDPKIDIVLTGRFCPEEISKIADLVTEFKEIKHYFQKGAKARKGIEF